MTNPAGNGYHGTVNKAASGRVCMNWTDVDNYTITASLTIDNINDIENYCRRVPFTEWNGPSCVTVDEANMVRLERCDVRYCGITFYFNLHFQHRVVTASSSTTTPSTCYHQHHHHHHLFYAETITELFENADTRFCHHIMMIVLCHLQCLNLCRR